VSTPPEPALPCLTSYGALLGYATETLALLDTAGVIRYVSPSYQSVLGHAPAALIGTAFVEGIHVDDRALVQTALAQVLAQPETPSAVTYRYHHADGSWLTIAATLSNRLSDSLLAGIVVVGRDMTAQQEAQAAAEAATARLHALQAVTDAALAHLSLEDLLRHVLDRVTEVLRVDNTAILLLDEDARELRLYVARGPEEAVAGQVRVPLGKGVAGRIAASQEPLIVDDMARADPANPFLREHIRSLLGVPLRVTGRVIGVLHVGTLAPHHFTLEDLQWLQLVADRVALAIDHAHLYHQAQAERAQAVERAHQLNAIFEAVPDGVFLFGRDGEVLQTNAAARAFFALNASPASYAAPLVGRLSCS
jgi:PAS domain S-box-containing protein